MLSGEVAERLRTWSPRGAEAGAPFARALIAAVEPSSWARARSLLWAACRLGDFAHERGIDPPGGDVLSISFIERFLAEGTPTWSGAARRTARSNLYFLARHCARPGPRPVKLSRERAKAPYGEAELAAYLSLADAQPTEARRQRASGLIALGAGAGLIGADLRLVTGRHIVSRSGGVLVEVHGAHPRTVPVRAELAERARKAAAWANGGFIVGGADPARRNVTSHLIASLSRGPDQDRLNLARLRSTWLARCAADIGLATFMAAAGITCSQHLGDVVARLDPGDEARAVALLGA